MHGPHRLALAVVLTALTSCSHAQQLSLPRSDGTVTPVVVFEPNAQGCPPLALISPGAGGTQNTMGYLGRALRRDGWRAIVLGHRESGPQALRSDMHRAGFLAGLEDLVADPAAYRGRFLDIDAALTWSEQRCHAPFKVLLGHSMGARTVLLEAGARNKLGLAGKNRFDAYVAMSPPPPDAVFPADAETTISAPMLLLTGTRDFTIAHQSYLERAQSFDELRSTCAWRGIIDGTTHLNFAGIGFSGKTESATIALGTTFLDALRNGHCARPPVLAGVELTAK